MPNTLRILMTADPELPVPPRLYGGIERIVSLLIDGLVGRGHEVTLVAHRESATPAALVPYPTTSSGGAPALARHATLVTRTALQVKPDIVHSFGRVAYLVPLLTSRVPKVMSYQRAVTPRTVRWASQLARDSMMWVACSRHIAAPVEHLGRWRVVYNAVPVDRMAYAADVPPEAPLMFLGRIESIKGAHVAIRVARAAGRKLIIAGNVPDTADARAYFQTEIEPHIDGGQVVYLGPVDDDVKGRLLRQCCALLMPILWDEPFGIVMAEALACGTPVIGFRRGAVPEVIDDGVTGTLCDTPEDMVDAVRRVQTLSRARCRQAAEDRFSQAALVDGYESVYRRMLSRPHRSTRHAREAAGV